MRGAAADAALRALTDILSDYTGQEVGTTRLWRVETALRPIVKELGLAGLPELVEWIGFARDTGTKMRIIDAMINHETSFFRDMAVFHAIERSILPRLRDQASAKTLRIWCAGCSFGEEPYSLAMMIRDMGAVWNGWKITITATDVSPISIDKARLGRFSQMEVQRGLAVDQLLRHFEPVGDEWQISREVRDMVRFQADNLLEPKHVSGAFDLILCRNVMLYFPEQARALACANLERHARTGGYLILGAGETLVGCQSAFTLSHDARCAYRIDTGLNLKRAS